MKETFLAFLAVLLIYLRYKGVHSYIENNRVLFISLRVITTGLIAALYLLAEQPKFYHLVISVMIIMWLLYTVVMKLRST